MAARYADRTVWSSDQTSLLVGHLHMHTRMDSRVMRIPSCRQQHFWLSPRACVHRPGTGTHTHTHTHTLSPQHVSVYSLSVCGRPSVHSVCIPTGVVICIAVRRCWRRCGRRHQVRTGHQQEAADATAAATAEAASGGKEGEASRRGRGELTHFQGRGSVVGVCMSAVRVHPLGS